MGKKQAPTELIPVAIDNACSAVLADVTDLGESTRRAAVRSVNSIMAATSPATRPPCSARGDALDTGLDDLLLHTPTVAVGSSCPERRFHPTLAGGPESGRSRRL